MFRDCLGIQITQKEMEVVDKICLARPAPNRAIDQIYMKPVCMLTQIKFLRDLLFKVEPKNMS